LSDLKEFTVEMNPATVSTEKAGMLRELGVNRVSMGVQSWDAGLLATLGRVHSSRQARRSYEISFSVSLDRTANNGKIASKRRSRSSPITSLLTA
jgi:oxygen-independent coproporphyrinogen-3 oxidase